MRAALEAKSTPQCISNTARIPTNNSSMSSLYLCKLTCGGTSSQGLAGRAAVDGENGHLVLRQRVQVVQLHAVLRPLDHLKDRSHWVSAWMLQYCLTLKNKDIPVLCSIYFVIFKIILRYNAGMKKQS